MLSLDIIVTTKAVAEIQDKELRRNNVTFSVFTESHNENCNSSGEQDETKLFKLENWFDDQSLLIEICFRLGRRIKTPRPLKWICNEFEKKKTDYDILNMQIRAEW